VEAVESASSARTNDLDPDPLALLEQLTPLDKRGQQQVGERAVLEKKTPEHVTIDGYVAHRLGHDCGQKGRLPREQVHFPEEARSAVADNLLTRGIGHRDLALDYRHERVILVADLDQLLADLGGPLLTRLGKHRELRAR
jgi:hypothetical protein